MEKIIKVKWSQKEQEKGGIVSIVFRNDDHVALKSVSGNALPAFEALSIINEAWNAMQPKGPYFYDYANALHLQRENPWRTQVRTGESGARNYWMEFLKNAEFGDIQRVSKIHVSMYGKLNEDIPFIWLGDAFPLLFRIQEDYISEEEEIVEFEKIWEVTPEFLKSFLPPGADFFVYRELEIEKQIAYISRY